MEQIIKEKISADHLLYVSLKYTKTCDVIVNLLLRWGSMIEKAMDKMLKHARKKKKISSVPTAPRLRIDKMREIFKKEQVVLDTIDLFEMFRSIENLQKIRENEFRKNVNLKVFFRGKEVNVNLDMLKEYSQTLENFISYFKQFISK